MMLPLALYEIVKILNKYKYRKSWRDKTHKSNEDRFYFISFETHLKKNQEDESLSLSKDGYIRVNKTYYSVSASSDKSKEMVDKVYKYIFEVLEKN